MIWLPRSSMRSPQVRSGDQRDAFLLRGQADRVDIGISERALDQHRTEALALRRCDGRTALLAHFGDIDRLRAASAVAISEVEGFGGKMAAELHAFLRRTE